MDPQSDNLSAPHSSNPSLGLGRSDFGSDSNISDPSQLPAVPDSASTTNDDNGDKLEAEWINKAKAIVEQTQMDPFEQSNQLSRLKATYLKTHYNKEIKIAEDIK